MYFFVLCEHMITRESYAYLQRDATRLATAMPCACNVWSRFVVLAACVGLVAGQACPSDVLEEYWLAGAPEQSCTDACAADGRTCVADAALPTSADCFEDLSSLPHIDIACDAHYAQAYETVTPNYITQLGATGCYHVTPSAASTFTLNCDYDATGYPSFRRLCPCTHYPPSPPPPSPPPPSPSLPPVSALCIQGYWPLFLTAAEANAVTDASASHTHAFGGVTYYMPNSFVGFQHGGTCPSHATRLSPSPPPPSLPPLESPPPPPTSPLACPVSDATCTDHGADEAAATAECAGNPLCYVLSTPTGAAPYTACTDFVQVGKWVKDTVTRWNTPHPTASTCAEAGFTRIDNPADCQLANDAIGFTLMNNLVGQSNAGDHSRGCTIFSKYSSSVGGSSDRELVFVDSGTEDCTKEGNGQSVLRSAACLCCETYGTITPSTYQACTCPPSPSLPPPPPLRPLGDTAVCIKGDSPLFTSQADADAHSPTGTSTATSWDLGNGVSYWKPDGYPWATSTGGDTCLEGTTTELIPIHLLPKQTCGGGALTFAEKYPHATATEAANACNLHGCGGGLAPASALNSSWYAWTGNGASNNRPTSVQEQCYAAWYINDIGFIGDNNIVHAHEQLYFMHNPNPSAGCGSQGLNHWDNNPVDSAAACLGCDYHSETCPSPPPTSPPPPEPPTTPPPATTSAAEPISPLAVIGIVGGGLIGSLLFAMFLICACAGSIGYAGQKVACDNPPDRFETPKKFRDWQRKCDEFNKDGISKESNVGSSLLKL